MFVTVTVPFAARPMMSFDVPLAVMLLAVELRVDDVVVADVVFVISVPALPTPGFAATFGDGVAPDDIVGLVVTLAVSAPIAPVVAGTVVTAVPPLMITPPPTPPLVMTSFGGELIDELTVISGFAVADGEMNCPVTRLPET
jgi:hypothetical protein